MSAAERSARHPCAAHPRAGVVLFDALVALFIMGVMAALLARGVQMQGRAAAEVSSRVQARRALRAAAAPLIGELRHAVLAGDAALSLHGDTLRIRTLVAGGSACATSDDRLALMAQPLDAPLASWRALPDSRDAMHLLLPEVSGDRCDRWGESGILGAAYSTAPPSPCTLAAGGSSLLLLPAVLPGAAPGEFMESQVVRRVAWRLTNGEGGWFLSRARCDAASGSASPACDASQPVAGPFLSPAAGGLRLRPLAGDGTPLDAALQDSARAVEIVLVAPVSVARPGAAPRESLRLVVPLPRPCS